MKLACISRAARFVLSATLVAQQAPTVRLTVTVKDQTGTVVPGAVVSLDPSAPGGLAPAKTYGQGQALLELPQGNHFLRETELGFKISTIKSLDLDIDPLNGFCRSITVVLHFADSGSPTVELSPLFQMPLDPPVAAALIPLNAPQTLADLPAVAAPCSALPHRFWRKSAHCKAA